MSVAVRSRARADIDLQRCADRHRDGKPAMLLSRMRAVIEADTARSANEEGARWAYRAALVDLASVCEELADDLPAPEQ